MPVVSLPEYNMDNSETGCCPRFDPSGWEDREIRLEQQLFVRATTISFLHIPLNMGRMMTTTLGRIQAAEAAPTDHYLVLSTDTSSWRGEHYFEVAKHVPGAEMVTLSATLIAQVFEGPYQDAGKWMRRLREWARSKGNPEAKLFFFYTTCPKCAKHYGQNYVVGFVQM